MAAAAERPRFWDCERPRGWEAPGEAGAPALLDDEEAPPKLAGPPDLRPSRAVSGGGRGVAGCPGAAFSAKKPSDANGFHRLRSPPKRTAACSPVSGVSLTMDGPAEAEKCVASY